MATQCRSCGEQIFTPQPKNIFEKRNHRIRTAIEQITGLEIRLEALLPQHICSCCLLDLSQAIAFRQRCLKTHENLHQRSPTKSIASSSSSPTKVVAKKVAAPRTIVDSVQLDCDPLFKREVLDDMSEPEDDKEFLEDDKEFLVDIKPVIKPPPPKRMRREEQKLPNSQSPRVMVKRLRVPESKKADSPPPVRREPGKRVRKRRPKPKVDRSIKRYVCDQCGWSFNDHSNMKDHKLRHFAEKYSCDDCGRKFYTLPLLRLHVRVHHKGEKPYVCKFCGMGFANSPSRCRHERQVHPNELTHACRICQKRFNSEKGRAKHEEGHKSDQPDVFLCLTCNKEFKEGQFLQRHYTTKYHRKRENMLVEGTKEEFQSDGDPEEAPGYMEEGQAEMEDSQAEMDILLEDTAYDQYENNEALLDGEEGAIEDFNNYETIIEELYT
ncbi:transcription factor Ouib [Drosophila takahashii]|uniref:transcription factor Ouib n=1 Tax=Drosophila takahashii TaxID=29030 RepID=UPI001CF7FB67|nr:myoneurin [Drosophila takahashii]